jgi:hypothetical protein
MHIEGLHESLKIVESQVPAVLAAGTTFNGAASGAVGIDTQGFSEALILLNVGAVAAAHTLDVSIWENSTNTTVGVTAVVNSAAVAQAFAQVVDGGAESTILVGRIQTKNTKRYLFVKVVVVGASGIATSVLVALGKGMSGAVAQTNAVAFKHL